MRFFAFVAFLAALIATVTAPAEARQRTYYVAADEITWNYLPLGHNALSARKPTSILGKYLGLSYRKAVYHEYTDASFTSQKTTPSDAYRGLLGPTIRAEVGDTVDVVFKNNTHIPLSIHVHGLFYKKNSEGAPYNDGAANGRAMDSGVPPRKTYTYHYEVPERSGPGPNDPTSILWMYHSHTDEVGDVNTGLIGPIVVTRRGMAREDGSPNDVNREVFAGFLEMEEDQSAFLPVNIKAFKKVKQPKVRPPDYLASMQFFTVNGFLYGNMPPIVMRQGERVRWYVMAGMSDFDFHTPHWHGNTVITSGMRADLVQLSPMGMLVADMTPDDPGTWLFHCHVNLHLDEGMEAVYQVLP